MKSGPEESEEAIVFLHGNHGYSRDWEDLMARVSAICRCVAGTDRAPSRLAPLGLFRENDSTGARPTTCNHNAYMRPIGTPLRPVRSVAMPSGNDRHLADIEKLGFRFDHSSRGRRDHPSGTPARYPGLRSRGARAGGYRPPYAPCSCGPRPFHMSPGRPLGICCAAAAARHGGQVPVEAPKHLSYIVVIVDISYWA